MQGCDHRTGGGLHKQSCGDAVLEKKCRLSVRFHGLKKREEPAKMMRVENMSVMTNIQTVERKVRFIWNFKK